MELLTIEEVLGKIRAQRESVTGKEGKWAGERVGNSLQTTQW